MNNSFVFTFVNFVLQLQLRLEAPSSRPSLGDAVFKILLGSTSFHPSLRLSSLTFDQDTMARNNTPGEMGCLLPRGKKPLDRH